MQPHTRCSMLPRGCGNPDSRHSIIHRLLRANKVWQSSGWRQVTHTKHLQAKARIRCLDHQLPGVRDVEVRRLTLKPPMWSGSTMLLPRSAVKGSRERSV